MMPSASHGANASSSDVTWWKSHITAHFDHLDPRNPVVTLTMLSASCDGDTNAKGITWPKSHVAPHFSCLKLRNAMVPFLMLLASCDATGIGLGCCCWHYVGNWDHATKSHVAPHFDCLDLKNALVPLTMLSTSLDADTNAVKSYDTNINANGILWCQC